MNAPRLSSAAFYSLFATLCFYLANSDIRFPVWLRGFLTAAGVLLAGFAIVDGLNWLAYNFAARLESIRRAWAISEASEALRLLAALSPAVQLELAAKRIVEYVGIVGRVEGEPYGPVFSLHTPQGKIPVDFIEKFINASTDQHLQPVRSYPEGTADRRHAIMLTQMLIDWGYALPASGNQAARWKHDRRTRSSSREKAIRLLFGEQT